MVSVLKRASKKGRFLWETKRETDFPEIRFFVKWPKTTNSIQSYTANRFVSVGGVLRLV